MKQLLDRNVNPNQRYDSYNWTTLHYAAENRNVEIIELLLEHGADINARLSKGNGDTPLHRAIPKNDNYDVFNALLSAGADINAKNGKGETPLYLAAVHNKEEKAYALLSAGADINAKTNKDETPISAVVKRRYLGLIKIFFDAETSKIEQNDLNAVLGKTLEFNIKNYDSDIVDFLLERGANPHQVKVKMTVHETSYMKEHSGGTITQTLKSVSVPVTGPAVFGPVINKDAYILNKFVEMGCSVDVKDSYGRTLLDVAKQKGDKDVLEIIERYLKN